MRRLLPCLSTQPTINTEGRHASRNFRVLTLNPGPLGPILIQPCPVERLRNPARFHRFHRLNSTRPRNIPIRPLKLCDPFGRFGEQNLDLHCLGI